VLLENRVSGGVPVPSFSNLSQSGKLSEIKLPSAEMQAAAKQADSHLKGNILELT
jgi:hypothetical protein